MRFYVIVLSVYALAATGLIVLLSLENRQLKMQPQAPVPQVNYDQVKDIALDDAPRKGAASAPVTMVQFSDYECPYCANQTEVLTRLMAEYPGKIQLVMKHFPLRFHANARPAAAAALAAQNQGKFWEMHQLLFGFQDQLNEETYLAAAESLGLDMARFAAEMQVSHWQERIDADLNQALALKVGGTPTVFVNGVWVPPSYEALKQAVDHFLATQDNIR